MRTLHSRSNAVSACMHLFAVMLHCEKECDGGYHSEQQQFKTRWCGRTKYRYT
jgi:hypothetical protein